MEGLLLLLRGRGGPPLWTPLSIRTILWYRFGEDPFLFQYDCPPVYNASSLKTWFYDFGVEEHE